MVVNGVFAIMHMTLILQLLIHLLEVLIFEYASLYESWVNGSMCIRVPKAVIFVVDSLEIISSNLFVFPLLYLITK